MTSSFFLGEFDAPVLVFGGAYSNLQASLALQAEVRRLGISPDHVICTGDIIAYCADPAATLELIRNWGIHVVMGNCEESLGEASNDCGCGFEEGTTCSLLSVNWYRYALNQVSADQQAWMRSLPRRLDFKMANQRFAVIHGSVSSINRFIFHSTPSDIKVDEIGQAQTDIIIGGHSGIPFGQVLPNGTWLNAGAIGMPANDGTARGWYMLLTPTPDRIQASWHPLVYDAEGAAAMMEKNGLTQGYHRTLLDGLWPSMDVLPETEREQQGKPLDPPAILLSAVR
jgi:predicted phosphodiesterase